MIRIMDALGRSHKHAAFDLSTACAYLGTSTDRYRVRGLDFGNGQLEGSASRLLQWEELDWAPSMILDHLEMLAKHSVDCADEIAAKHAERSAARARKKVRHICKAMAVDSMITLTYRALVTDLALCKRHVKEFNRRLERVLPGFQFVVGYEEQKRGAWHAHLATSGIPRFFMVKNALGVPCKVKSYDLLRSVWLSVVGVLGGAANLSRSRSQGATCAQIAGYIAKYITKAYATGAKFSNRWGQYGDCEVPLPVELGVFEGMLSAVRAVFDLVLSGQVVGRVFLPHFQDFFFLASESPPGAERC